MGLPLLLVILATGSACFGQPGRDRGQLDASPALFNVMAAMNAAGYDAGVQSPANHPLRDAIRKEIQRRNPPVLAELRAFYRQHRQENAAQEYRQYVSLGLLLEEPPKFEFRIKEHQLPPDVAAMKDVLPLLQRFHQEAGIEQLWQASQPHINQVLQRYQPPTIRAINEVSAYLRAPTSGGYLGRGFQIFVDLLGAPNQIQRHSFLDDYFLVATNSAEPQANDIRETYLHFLLDPLATKYWEQIEKKRGVGDYAQGAPFLPDYLKQDFLLLTTKCLIRAIEARLAPPSRRAAMVQEAMSQGFVLAAHFSEALPAYEKQEVAMRLYFPELIKSIDLKREETRLEKLEFSDQRIERKAKPVTAAPPPEAPPIEKALDQAEELYTGRDLDKARQAFAEVLTATDSKTDQARAYYGLARIATLRKDPELAVKLFDKALELGPPPQEKAWTLVYLGRLSAAAGDGDAALGRYREALAVEGASAKAREAAETGLRQASRSQQKE